MLFKTRFHAGIRDGSIRLTFRRWKRPQVKVGGQYRVGASDQIEVSALRMLSMSSLTPDDARDAGFESLEALRAAVGDRTGAAADDAIYRIDFRHVGKWRDCSDPDRRAADLAGLLRRDRQRFKVDVRKLKSLGLTLSLAVGYRLSPRGRVFLARRS